MRLFIAIELSDQTKQELLSLQRALPDAKLRNIGKEQMHLTLKFIGETTPEKAERIKQALKTVKLKPFKTCLSNIGVFPSENHARVIWAGLEPEEELINLQKQIDLALEKEVPKDKQFKPHLTLARVKFINDKKRFIKGLKKIKVNNVCFEIKEFKLKKSTLTREGSIYEDLEIIAL